MSGRLRSTRMVTAHDIAQLVGVSVSTVGRAMVDDPRISAATKAKVRRAAEQHGYVGSMPARVVRGASSNLLGLILPDIRNDFYSAIAQALSEACDRHNKRLVLSLSTDDRDVEARHIRELVAARAAGVIIVPTAAPRRESIQMLQHTPCVQLLRRTSKLGNVWFGMDDEPALRDATAHLLRLGHRRIAYFGGDEALSTGAARVQGFRRAFKEAGLSSVKEGIEMTGPPTVEFGVRSLEQLLHAARRPTAIVIGSVHITAGVIEMIEKARVNVPDDLSLIGFGDAPWFQWWRGGLTALRPPVKELATSCGLWFLDQLEMADRRVAKSHSAMISSSLVIRATTRPLESHAERRAAAVASTKR